MEIEESEEEEEEVEEEQEKLEGGKRRKAARKGRLDVDKSVQLLESLSRENKALCMRSLGGSIRSLGGSGSCNDASDSKREKNSVNVQKKLVTQEDFMKGVEIF